MSLADVMLFKKIGTGVAAMLSSPNQKTAVITLNTLLVTCPLALELMLSWPGMLTFAANVGANKHTV